jgi:O-antigen ligase
MASIVEEIRLGRAGQPRLPILVAGALGALALGLASALLPYYVSALLLATAGFAILFLLRPEVAILVVLLCRASLDAFQDVYLPVPGLSSLNVAGLLAIFLFGGTVILILTRRIQIGRDPVLVPYGVFLSICLLSLLLSPDKGRSVSDWLRLASYMAVYVLIVATVRTAKAVEVAIDVIALSAVVPLMVGVFQFFSGGGMFTNVGIQLRQITSVFVHPNGYGIYLALLAPMVLMSVVSTQSRLRQIVFAGLAGAMLFFTIQTYARVAWAGLLAGIAIIGSIRYRRLIVFVPLLVLVAWFTPSIVDKLLLVFTPSAETNSLITRLTIWTEALALFRSSPLLGRGLGSFNTLSEFVQRNMAATPGTSVHNTYIQLLAETGILGLGSYLWVQAILGIRIIRSVRSVRARCLQPAVLGALSMFVANLLMGLTDNILTSPVVQWYVWAVAGLAVVALRLNQEMPTDN